MKKTAQSILLDRLTRREFLRRSSLLGVASVAAPWAMNLAVMGEVAAQTVGSNDYKALVCIFLYGGNDYGNTLVPYDQTNYNEYSRIRVGLATPRADLASTQLTQPVTALSNGRVMALAPQMSPLVPLWEQGKLGMVLNVGTLIQPTTLAQYNAKSVPLPPKLFSHNDQQSVWQSSSPEGATSGWGGRIGDLFLGSNSQQVFTCVNTAGNAVYMSGKTAVQYQVSTTGSTAVNSIVQPVYGSQACADAMRALTTGSYTNLLEAEHSRIMTRSVSANQVLSGALTNVTVNTPFATDNSLASQLQMVARMIAARNTLGVKRQVFFVSLGGFDLHDFLPTQHPGLLTNVAAAMRNFYDATVELGVQNDVTTFTGSDFGRTLTSNGDGSDHGWGSHHFVMGGAVKGRNFWGKLPAVAVNGTEDVGQGRLLPTTSVDQLGATLATWFGVSNTNLPLVFPGIGNFNLGTLPIFA